MKKHTRQCPKCKEDLSITEFEYFNALNLICRACFAKDRIPIKDLLTKNNIIETEDWEKGISCVYSDCDISLVFNSKHAYERSDKLCVNHTKEIK